MTRLPFIAVLVAAMAGVGGLQLVATGFVGEYVWRALEEARRRPQFVIEAATGATLGTEEPAAPAPGRAAELS